MISALLPKQCISVATANTDNTGVFPLPGTVTTPAAFENVPILPKSVQPYVMEVTAPGYDPLFVQVQPGNGHQQEGRRHLQHQRRRYIHELQPRDDDRIHNGIAFPIVPPNPGQTTLVQVFAEDHGTNNIESALPMPITVGSNPNIRSRRIYK